MLPKVSVIVPVYNVEQYLRQCMDSILSQTLHEIEVICVDDGSTDSSVEILREYEAKDERVRVLCQQNRFAGVARNAGIAVAQGEYYVFLDADDFFEPELLEVQYEQCTRLQADVGICGADRYDNREQQFLPSPWLANKSLFAGKETSNAAALGDAIFELTTPVPWNKMFRAEFVKAKKLRFQETQRANDAYFVISALNLADSIACDERVLVHYRIGMTTNLQANNDVSPFDFCKALEAIKDQLKASDVYKRVERGFINFALNQCEYNLRSLKVKTNGAYETLAQKIREKYVYLFDLAVHDETFFTDKRRYSSFWEMISAVKVPALSVIVPVYNVEKYLEECLDSILAQTFADIEVICVNDGSTDSSLEILRRYEQKDPRIVVIDKEQNEGLMLARKTGVERAIGEYTLFVDSDDVVAPTLSETVIDKMRELQPDMLQYNIGVKNYSSDEQKGKWLADVLSVKFTELSRTDLLKKSYITKENATSLWGKVYKTGVCKKAYEQIPNVHCFVGEDIYTLFYLAYYTQKYVGLQSEPLYFYRYGLGVGNTDKMPLTKFALYNKMGELPGYVAGFLSENKSDEICYAAQQAMAHRMFMDVCTIYRDRLNPEDQEEAARMMIRTWNGMDICDEVVQDRLGISMQQFVANNIEIPIYTRKGEAFSAAIPKVSVIIPVYNVQDFLQECLDSVLNQTLAELEIICVNDGSLDDSLTIVEAYAQKDPRITVISKRNGGLSSARNAGYEIASGKYIYFLDSDDYLVPDAMKTLYETAEQDQLDLIYFGAESFFDGENIKDEQKSYDGYYDRKALFEEPVAGDVMLKALQKERLFRCSVPLQFFRREMLEKSGVMFREGMVHEDELFSPLVVAFAQKVRVITDKLYMRRVRADSIMGNTKNARHFIGLFTVYATLLAEVMVNRNNWSAIAKECLMSHAETMYWSSRRMYDELPPKEVEKILPSLTPEYRQLFKELPYKRERVRRDTGNENLSDLLLRKLRGGVRCFREHGLLYTIGRVFYKVKNLLKKILRIKK